MKKKLIDSLKKDLNRLQETMKREGDLLIKNLKKTVEDSETREAIRTSTKEVEEVIEKRIKSMEPALNNFMSGVRTNAQKYGIDVSKFEAKITSAAKAARSKMSKATAKATTKKPAKAKKSKKTTTESSVT